jgi:hypothetical protein
LNRRCLPPDNDPDPIYKTKIAVTDQVIYVEHYAASGETFIRNEQYRDQRFWGAEKPDNWSGVSVKRPDWTMVGSIRMYKGGQWVEYTEKLYRGGKLEVTTASAYAGRSPGRKLRVASHGPHREDRGAARLLARLWRVVARNNSRTRCYPFATQLGSTGQDGMRRKSPSPLIRANNLGLGGTGQD